MAKKKKIENPRFTAGVTARAWFDVPLRATTLEEAITEANDLIKNEGIALVEQTDAYNESSVSLMQITDNDALEGF